MLPLRGVGPGVWGNSQADPAFRQGLSARCFMAAPRPRTLSELRSSDRKLRSKIDFVHDAPRGAEKPCSTVLTIQEEATVVAFRKQTLLPLDDCLYALQATIPHLTRSSLHRCPQRHGISRLQEIAGEKPTKQSFKSYSSAIPHR
jgi:hypothetical protein